MLLLNAKNWIKEKRTTFSDENGDHNIGPLFPGFHAGRKEGRKGFIASGPQETDIDGCDRVAVAAVTATTTATTTTTHMQLKKCMPANGALIEFSALNFVTLQEQPIALWLNEA
jgi:hypothetical protein